jgi:hypothetical protein
MAGQLEIKPRAVVAIRARTSVGRVDVNDATVPVRRIVARAVDATTSEVLYLGGKDTYIFIELAKNQQKKSADADKKEREQPLRALPLRSLQFSLTTQRFRMRP